jgi:hypothetical protein
LHKLIGYRHAALNDSVQAITFIDKYQDNEGDSNAIPKDYAALAPFYAATDHGSILWRMEF